MQPIDYMNISREIKRLIIRPTREDGEIIKDTAARELLERSNQ